MEITFGKTQLAMSKRMQTHPRIAKWIQQIFGYTQVGNYARAQVFKSLLNEIPLEDCKEVLDLGCGQGEYAFFMAANFPSKSITALDVEADRLTKIQKVAQQEQLHNLKTFHGPIEALPKSNPTYDLIYSVDVFEHILENEMPFSAVYQQLKPGGYTVIKMPARTQKTIFPAAWFASHQRWLEEEHIGQVYELEDLIQRMELEGFQVKTAFYADGLLARLAWEFNYLAAKIHPVIKLCLLPMNKLLVRLDKYFGKGKKGNTIQVIGQKII